MTRTEDEQTDGPARTWRYDITLGLGIMCLCQWGRGSRWKWALVMKTIGYTIRRALERGAKGMIAS